MAKRTYGQHCGLAVALDVVGERWALLVVRDLAPGPRRFTDLFRGLPGIATDVLADRLRALEAAGAVEQVEVTEPVPGRLYALTPRGHELARIAGELAAWGLPLLPPGSRTPLRRNPRWVLQTMARRYRGGLPPGEYRWAVGDQALRVEVGESSASLRYGFGPGDAVMAVRCTDAELFRLLRWARDRRRDPAEAGEHGVRVEGADLLAEYLDAMPIVADALV